MGDNTQNPVQDPNAAPVVPPAQTPGDQPGTPDANAPMAPAEGSQTETGNQTSADGTTGEQKPEDQTGAGTPPSAGTV